MVESTALEMRHTRKGIVGSNPTLSASRPARKTARAVVPQPPVHRSAQGRQASASRYSRPVFVYFKSYNEGHASSDCAAGTHDLHSKILVFGSSRNAQFLSRLTDGPLIWALAADDRCKSQPEYFEVEFQARVFYIPDIKRALILSRDVPATVDLRPAC